MKPTIVVASYNRPRSLQRLLQSLQQAEIPADVRLVISIDYDEEHGREIQQIASQFSWPIGEKVVIAHEKWLGLTNHIFFCGDLSQTYDSLILLEDDLIVSPMFYHFATQALNAFADDSNIAGISLNTLWFNGYTHTPFTPYLDDGDNFFCQVSWYQGQAYTRQQWADFMDWRQSASRTVTADDGLHEMFSTFPETDWFPFMMKYLVQRGKYYVFPRESLTTNFGDPGTHFEQSTTFFQVPLQTRQRQFRLQTFSQSVAVYDAFQEMLPERLNRLTDQLTAYDYAVDLNASKSRRHLKADYVLSSRPCAHPLHTFGQVMWPMEANVVTAIPGHQIYFGKKEGLVNGRRAQWATAWQNHAYFNRQRPLSLRQQLKLAIGKWFLRIKIK